MNLILYQVVETKQGAKASQLKILKRNWTTLTRKRKSKASEAKIRRQTKTRIKTRRGGGGVSWKRSRWKEGERRKW